MWKQLVEFMEQLRNQPTVVVFHNPEQPMPQPDLTLAGAIRFVPHASVPEGQAWVYNNGPSGRIITED